MDVDDAAALARRLMDEHGLSAWQFRFDRARRRFGCCWRTRKLITLSKPLTELNGAAEVGDTILHEIAHAIAPGGHGPAWRRICIQIGAKPRRCFNSAMVNLPVIKHSRRYVAVCRCPTQHFRRRKPKATYLCRRCRKQLEWTLHVESPDQIRTLLPVRADS
jgi:predicted SprT family Zn-dependent metalloprotease